MRTGRRCGGVRGGLEDWPRDQVIAAFSPGRGGSLQGVDGAPDKEGTLGPRYHWRMLWQMNTVGFRGKGDFERAVNDEERMASRHDAQALREREQLFREKVLFAQLNCSDASLDRFTDGVNEGVRFPGETAVRD